ncbi:MAG: DoxX family protein [Gaiellaceae bacterium MAG52_C11]|nr:DoxX family protein [Candidatus Gaiellasilicea maunaloa]
MEYGLLLLRLLVGLAFAAHGTQKLFGWFGGGRLEGTAGFFASLGYRAPALMALLAGVAEVGGGLLLASGLGTPLAALALATVMLNAIVTVKWREGFLSGYELEVVYLAIVVALAATGPGRLSLDRALDWDDNITGTAWGSVVLVGAIVIAVVTTTLGRARADTGEMAA